MASSAFAERRFLQGVRQPTVDARFRDTVFELMPAFSTPRAAGPCVRKIYIDDAMACVRLSGDHPRATKADYEQRTKHVAGDAP